MTRLMGSIFLAGLTVLGVGGVSGQNYPNKPIRIFTSEAGANGDFTARLVARGLTSALGQSVIVENRPTIIAAETVAQAAPDGYTVLSIGSTFWLGPLMQKMRYDPVSDFLPASLVSRQPNVLVVHPSLPAKSVKELITLAKTKPGALNYASTGVGTSSQLLAELFKSMAGVNMLHIPYKGAGQAFTDLISGQVQVMFPIAAAAAPHVKSGRMKALAVTSADPSALYPGLPTVAASGLPGFEAVSTNSLWVPAKTPEAIIRRLNQEVVQFLGTTAVKEQFLSVGSEAAPSTPEQLGAAMKSEMVRMDKVSRTPASRLTNYKESQKQV